VTTWWGALRDRLRSLVRPAPTAGGRTGPRPADARRTSGSAPGAAATSSRTALHPALPDYDGRVDPVYRPAIDGDADPGEVVWTWVPYEDDPTQGKDRPVLVVGHDDPWLLALMLTSKDHSRNAAAEARRGRHWLDVGTGPWDAKRRPSEIRLDRVLRLDPARVRREGAVFPRGAFDEVVRSLAALKGW
jgi:hypothetical protein